MFPLILHFRLPIQICTRCKTDLDNNRWPRSFAPVSLPRVTNVCPPISMLSAVSPEAFPDFSPRQSPQSGEKSDVLISHPNFRWRCLMLLPPSPLVHTCRSFAHSVENVNRRIGEYMDHRMLEKALAFLSLPFHRLSFQPARCVYIHTVSRTLYNIIRLGVPRDISRRPRLLNGRAARSISVTVMIARDFRDAWDPMYSRLCYFFILLVLSSVLGFFSHLSHRNRRVSTVRLLRLYGW